MFYLGQAFNIIRSYPARSLSFCFLSFSLILICFFHAPIDSRLSELSKSNLNLPYFHALVSGRENHSRISRNLQKLPGVEKVEILAEEKIKQQVQEIVGDLSSEITDSFLTLNYAGLKVIFSENLQSNSQKLIRDYLTRLVGASKVTMGPTQSQLKEEKSEGFLLTFILDHSFWALLTLMLIFWFASGVLFVRPLTKQAYLVEQFQRRDKVAFKSYCTFYAALCFLPLIVGLLLGQASLMVGAVIIIGFLPAALTLRKVSWH